MHEYFLEKLWIVHVKCKLVLKPAVPSSPPLREKPLWSLWHLCWVFCFCFFSCKNEINIRLNNRPLTLWPKKVKRQETLILFQLLSKAGAWDPLGLPLLMVTTGCSWSWSQSRKEEVGQGPSHYAALYFLGRTFFSGSFPAGVSLVMWPPLD